MTGPGRIIIDGRPIPFGADDSVAVAMMRAGLHPNHGGTLCLAGDCGNCVVEVDGVAYVRSCQIRARPELVAQRHPAADAPPMPTASRVGLTNPPPAPGLAVAAGDGASSRVENCDPIARYALVTRDDRQPFGLRLCHEQPVERIFTVK